jgi:hypothetical protein
MDESVREVFGWCSQQWKCKNDHCWSTIMEIELPACLQGQALAAHLPQSYFATQSVVFLLSLTLAHALIWSFD